jgi:hypothetical protein
MGNGLETALPVRGLWPASTPIGPSRSFDPESFLPPAPLWLPVELPDHTAALEFRAFKPIRTA